MSLNKSTINKLFGMYLFSLYILLSILFITPFKLFSDRLHVIPPQYLLIDVIILGIFFLPFLYMLWNSKRKKLLFSAALVFFLIIAILATYFRQIRNTLPPPIINEEKIIGFAQFAGYPLYFDTLLFFFVFLTVIIITGITLLFYEKR